MVFVALMACTLAQTTSSEPVAEKEILALYSNKLVNIVKAYSDNIYVKERRTEPQRTDPLSGITYPPRISTTSMHICNSHVACDTEDSRGESKSRVNVLHSFYMTRRAITEKWWYSQDTLLDESAFQARLAQELRRKPISLTIPYKLWFADIDVLSLIHNTEQKKKTRIPGDGLATARLVSIKKISKKNGPVYRFYYEDGRSLADDKSTIDGIACCGHFDVDPALEWVIVESLHRSYSYEVIYDGRIADVPAIKLLNSKTPYYDPYIKLEVLQIEHWDTVNPEEYTIEFYRSQDPLDVYSLFIYYWPWALGTLVLSAIVLGLVFSTRKSRRTKPTATA